MILTSRKGAGIVEAEGGNEVELRQEPGGMIAVTVDYRGKLTCLIGAGTQAARAGQEVALNEIPEGRL